MDTITQVQRAIAPRITLDAAEEGGESGVEIAAHGIGSTLRVDQVGSTLRADKDEATPENNENMLPSSNDNTVAPNNDDSDNAKKERGISLQELRYGAESFHAILKPVSITMIFAALAVMYINTAETIAAGEQALDQTYQVFSIEEDDGAAKSLGLGLVNSFIVVLVIGLMTFLLVLLYKYRCMKVLIGYMVIASIMLLGFLGGQMFLVAINKYQLTIDQISFYFTMYNFSIVGVVAMYYMKGMPPYINQVYLIATSVIVAWQLSYFNDWMAWALLIMLALYDLCAVLSPCGPLKALVNEMSKDDAPVMPGLLYEAELPANAIRPGRGRKSETSDGVRNESTVNESRNEAQQNSESGNEGSAQEDACRENGVEANVVTKENEAETREQPPASTVEASSKPKSKRSTSRKEASERTASSSQSNQGHVQSENDTPVPSTLMQETASPTTTLPLAIAKIYKLPIVSPGPLEASISLDTSSPTAYLQQEFSAEELQTEIEVNLPRGGGRIESTRNKKGELRYVVYGKNGEVKRTLLVCEDDGKVLEIVPNPDAGKPDPEDNTIKLGLGDFIFYSVLVSKAAGNGFASFVACFLSIMTGLGGTLVLLAVYHKALPALPISIFLAVVMFVLTIFCMEPWIQDMWRAGPFYV